MKLKKMMKRGLAAFMAAMMLWMVGCGAENTLSDDNGPVLQESVAQSETTEEPTELSIAIWNADAAFSGDAVLDEIEKKLNIKIVPMNVTWDDYTQKVQLWAASGSLPDLFIGADRTTTTYPQWAKQGVIKAIPEDLSAYPNLQEYLSGQAAKDAMLDGTLYCIPRQTYPSQVWTCIDRVICYRWDLAQKAGVTKEPETWEEFKEMILAIMKADPDQTGVGGMTASDKNLLSGMFLPYASPIIVDGGSSFKWVKDDDGLYKPAYFVEDTVSAFSLARDFYESGVIESDIALTTNQSAEEKFLQGKSAAIITSGGFENKYENIARYWADVHGSDYLDDVKALHLMPGKDGTLTYPMWGYAWSETYINASVNDEKLDKILQLFDYLLSDEGAFLSTYGPEGDMYDMLDGKVVMKDETAVVSDTYPSAGALGILARWNPSTYDSRFVSVYPSAYIDVDLALVEQAKNVEIPEYNSRCTQLVMELGLDFSLNPEDDFLNIMTGAEDVETMWADLCEHYESKGLSEMIATVNDHLAGE